MRQLTKLLFYKLAELPRAEKIGRSPAWACWPRSPPGGQYKVTQSADIDLRILRYRLFVITKSVIYGLRLLYHAPKFITIKLAPHLPGVFEDW